MPNMYWGHMGYNDPIDSLFPEDAEKEDKVLVAKHIEEYFDKKYPPFEPEVITSITGKEYYLPALKVLKRVDGEYFSPSKSAQWKDMELQSVCKQYIADWQAKVNIITHPDGTHELVSVDYSLEPVTDRGHSAPDENCDCGIYGSVNLEELNTYFERDRDIAYRRAVTGVFWDSEIQEIKKSEYVLCIIEPSPDAKVILCRKGWKASKAFISEILNETISVDQASSLLSVAWHRAVEVRRIYENR